MTAAPDGGFLCQFCTAAPAQTQAANESKASMARALRLAATDSEMKLDKALKSLRAQGFHFRRSASLFGYIADFYCAQAKLVIELDGKYHATDKQKAYDQQRDANLLKRGIRTVRFSSSMAFSEAQGILNCIRASISCPK